MKGWRFFVISKACCVECGEEYNPKRAALGYRVCLDCGEVSAKKIARYRSKCSAPAFNKGAYQPVMSKDDAKWVGK